VLSIEAKKAEVIFSIDSPASPAPQGSPGEGAKGTAISESRTGAAGTAGDSGLAKLAGSLKRALDRLRRAPIFWLGLAALVLPSFAEIAVRDWGTDQAAHAPIVLATAIWLFVMNGPRAMALAKPPSGWATACALLPWLLLYAAAKITGLLEVRGLAIYGAMIAILFGIGGVPVLRALWFPLAYCLFLIPIPDSLVDVLTQPVKLLISQAAVETLSAFDYPVASSGVSIYIGQFELLIAAACAGLNSLISLTAIGIFYVYLQHRASWVYTLALVVAIFPIAVFANFVRVLTLVLVTYHFGEATAQDFLHEAAGLFMFAVALLAIFALDRLARSVIGTRGTRHV
jgi:exosortase